MVRDLLAQGVPRKLPPAPFAWLGANAQMKWAEWAAGAELLPLSRRQAEHRPRLWRFEMKILTLELSTREVDRIQLCARL